MYGCSRVPSERCNSIVRGYLPCVVSETPEVLRIDDDAHGVDHAYPRHGGYDAEVIHQFVVRRHQLAYHKLAFGYLALYLRNNTVPHELLGGRLLQRQSFLAASHLEGASLADEAVTGIYGKCAVWQRMDGRAEQA